MKLFQAPPVSVTAEENQECFIPICFTKNNIEHSSILVQVELSFSLKTKYLVTKGNVAKMIIRHAPYLLVYSISYLPISFYFKPSTMPIILTSSPIKNSKKGSGFFLRKQIPETVRKASKTRKENGQPWTMGHYLPLSLFQKVS